MGGVSEVACLKAERKRRDDFITIKERTWRAASVEEDLCTVAQGYGSGECVCVHIKDELGAS